MDFHPIIVHFPIALLTVYAVLELMRGWTKDGFWKPLRAVLVITGTVGAFIALQTGDIAAESFRSSPLQPVLELHSLLANITTMAYGILAGTYAIDLLSQRNLWQRLWFIPKKATVLLEKVATFVLSSPTIYILVIIAFTTLSLVGALGGILVYGPDMDPITKVVYWMFF